MKRVQLPPKKRRPATRSRLSIFCLLFVCALASLGFQAPLQASGNTSLHALLARYEANSLAGENKPADSDKGLSKKKGSPSPRMARAAASNAVLSVENLDHFPDDNQLLFSLIQRPWRRFNPLTPFNANHDTVTVRLHNKGTENLKVTGLQFSRPNSYKVVQLGTTTFNPATMLPITVSPGGSVDVVIRFVNDPSIVFTRVIVLHDTLSILSNDNLSPVKPVQLHAMLQYAGESGNEPTINEVLDVLNFKSRTGYTRYDPSGGRIYRTTTADEIDAQYYARVDASKPVTVRQMAAYHGCCDQTEAIEWYGKGKSTVTNLFTHIAIDGQSLLPRIDLPNKAAFATFEPSGAFGFKVHQSFSDTTNNPFGRIGLRVYKAIDGNNKLIPNAYIMIMDYVTGSPNFDYQDNLYYITNIRPEDPSIGYAELAATPSAVLDFGDGLLQSSKSLGMKVKNLGTVETNSPSLNITSIQLTGTNKEEFLATLPVDLTLSPQESGTIAVKFTPTSTGLKKADLLVYHTGTSTSPLRIPLYGIGESACVTTDLIKRIKSAATSASSVTIKNKVWESDVDYRKGNVKLDNTTDIHTQIIGTDEDALYRSYLSSNANLDEIRYEIPVTPGKYQVRLHFAENYFNTVGSRVFNVSMENELMLSNLDIYGEVGYKAALVKDFMVTSNDILNINFNPSVNRLALSAIELFAVTTSAAEGCGGGGNVACTSTGTILREQWNNVTGTSVSAIPVNSPPTSTSQLSSFAGPVNLGDNYASRVRGYLCVPQTGDYTFWVAGDDNCQLWLSTNDLPGSKVLLASVPGATSRNQWTKYPEQKSAPVSLVKDKRYYIEALQKEGTSNDHLEVAWALGTGSPVVIPGSVLSPYGTATARLSPDEPSTTRESTLSVTPNPFQGQTTIHFFAAKSEKAFVALYDTQGALIKVLYSGQTEAGTTQTLSLEAGSLRAGLYLVRLNTQGKTTYKKVILLK